MSKHLERDLEDLQRDLVALAASVEEAIQKATHALQHRDAEPAEQVIAGDSQIDQEEKTLSREVFEQEFGARFVGEMPDPCEVCGGPSPDVPIVIAARPSELKLRCAVCKRLVDAQGRTRVHRTRDGRPALRIVVIPEEPVTEEDMLRLCGQHAA